MNKDLKIIKKKYGEGMMHLCRELFPTLLEQEGLLPRLLHDNFKESRSLVKDIIDNNLEEEFKNYIYNQVDVENNYEEVGSKRPEELLKEAGYKLYECHNEEEIQSFRKYYSPGEALCTFNGGRLNRCFVFFAIKENVDEIKRENFPKPERQDEYGTSVISIQFTRDNSHTLSIKNRYNHTVNNPDSTFSNNLDNIIPGLTNSFDKYYGLHQSHLQNSFEIPGYVRANDGKYYKYNYEINNIYYCENNVIIDNFEVKEYPHEQYIVLDYFILDLKNKRIQTYWNDMELEDSFPNTIGTIKDIKIENDKDNKNILIKTDNSDEVDVIITLDKNNRIIALKNDKVENIGNSFLSYNNSLTSIELPNATSIGNRFLCYNKILTEIQLPNVTSIGNSFLCFNNSLTHIELQNATNIGNDFLLSNKLLTSIELPNVTSIGNRFLFNNVSLTSIALPNVTSVGNLFLHFNNSLISIELQNATNIGNYFLKYNNSLTSIELPNATSIGDGFLYSNRSLTSIELPNAQIIGDFFCDKCKNIDTVNIPLIPELEEKLKLNGKHI
ncbi:MAG TPA: leucine-rich repeat protein [Candidatus Onthousia excrementipullorum]|uniref:Leucine-rich repeat protein n=1 Tax=Candidatus Onthousia excrementipullorum TaxID=2840884 RepID=A0A9D1J2T8_9FIRM|nr:leucine-rich repeat protein [Candidatus Onthousia excrementipullorum]